MYASGKLDALEKVYLDFDWINIAYFFDVVFPKSGLIDGKKVADFVREHVHAENIEHLPLPFQAVATDISTGEEVALDRGDVIEAVRASISVPAIYDKRHGDTNYPDKVAHRYTRSSYPAEFGIHTFS